MKYCLSSDFRNTLKLIYYYHQYSFNNCSSLCIYYYCHSVFITSNFSLRIKQIVMKWNIFMFIMKYIQHIYISFFNWMVWNYINRSANIQSVEVLRVNYCYLKLRSKVMMRLVLEKKIVNRYINISGNPVSYIDVTFPYSNCWHYQRKVTNQMQKSS